MKPIAPCFFCRKERPGTLVMSCEDAAGYACDVCMLDLAITQAKQRRAVVMGDPAPTVPPTLGFGTIEFNGKQYLVQVRSEETTPAGSDHE